MLSLLIIIENIPIPITSRHLIAIVEADMASNALPPDFASHKLDESVLRYKNLDVPTSIARDVWVGCPHDRVTGGIDDHY